MTTTAKTKTMTRATLASKDVGKPREIRPEYKLIRWKDLQTSPTNPRRKIDEQSIDSLAGSIRTQGVLEPLIVRSTGNRYEIVCGERRYQAARIAAVHELPCLVRKLSDEQVLDIQIHENLHREDIRPMDEAYSYQFLKEKLGCEIKDLALRVGKPEGYVLNRLKLNQLITEAQEDMDRGHLPLAFALEIAKYPSEIQKLIYEEVYRKEGKYQGNNYVVVPIKGQTVQWKSFVEWINTNIHRMLCRAPFNPKATNLRPDGLACVNCPDRTGAAVSLFEPNQIGKKDACLHPPCYRRKIDTHLQIRRRELAEIAGIDQSAVPIIRSRSYADGEDYFGSESAVAIDRKRGGSEKICSKTVSGIDIEPGSFGATVQVCLRSSQCKVHWPLPEDSSLGSSAKGKSAEDEAAERVESRRMRREEIWNAKVAEAVRVRVFKQAAEKFESEFSIVDVGRDFLPQLISRFWRMTSSGDANNLQHVVNHLLTEWEGETSKTAGIPIYDGRSGITYFKKTKRGLQVRLLFLLIHGFKGSIGYGNNYTSQKEVRELAMEFQVDYYLIDAETRLELCSKKYQDVHQIYVDAVRGNKKESRVPRLFTERWKPKD